MNGGWKLYPHEEQFQRARDAGPELLEALSKAVKWLAICDDPRCLKDLQAAEQAVRKATGS